MLDLVYFCGSHTNYTTWAYSQLSFYRQFDMCSYMIISCISCDLHLRPQILTVMNTNNQPNGKNNSPFACNSF